MRSRGSNLCRAHCMRHFDAEASLKQFKGFTIRTRQQAQQQQTIGLRDRAYLKLQSTTIGQKLQFPDPICSYHKATVFLAMIKKISQNSLLTSRFIQSFIHLS